MNTGQIIKSKGGQQFTQVNNSVLKNDLLSMQAKGLYAYLQSLPSDWVIYKNELNKHFSNGRDAVYGAFKELQDAGLILTVKIIGNNGKLGYNHIVYNDYQTDFESNGSNQTKKPYTENPSPYTGKPLTENQCTENPSLQSIDRQITNKQNNNISSLFTFEAFWLKYDKKKGKLDAEPLWDKLDDITKQKIMIHLDQYRKTEKQFKKDPARYLRHRGWEDEVILNQPAEDSIRRQIKNLTR